MQIVARRVNDLIRRDELHVVKLGDDCWRPLLAIAALRFLSEPVMFGVAFLQLLLVLVFVVDGGGRLARAVEVERATRMW